MSYFKDLVIEESETIEERPLRLTIYPDGDDPIGWEWWSVADLGEIIRVPISAGDHAQRIDGCASADVMGIVGSLLPFGWSRMVLALGDDQLLDYRRHDGGDAMSILLSDVDALDQLTAEIIQHLAAFSARRYEYKRIMPWDRMASLKIK